MNYEKAMEILSEVYTKTMKDLALQQMCEQFEEMIKETLKNNVEEFIINYEILQVYIKSLQMLSKGAEIVELPKCASVKRDQFGNKKYGR